MTEQQQQNNRVTLATLLSEQKAMHEDILSMKELLMTRDVRLRIVEVAVTKLETKLGLWAIALIGFSTLTSAIAAYIATIIQ